MFLKKIQKKLKQVLHFFKTLRQVSKIACLLFAKLNDIKFKRGFIMKLYEEFKLYENMWTAEAPLTESRSIADIEAEIAKLQQELTQAKIAEKKASYEGNLPKTVWAWDIYLEPAAKGTWTSIENDLVFETKDKALNAAWTLLNELDNEGELEDDPDDYYVEAFEVPLSSVSASILEFSKLAYLI